MFTAPSRYTTRRIVFWLLVLVLPSPGALAPLVLRWFIANVVNGEKPWITVLREAYEHGSGPYVEERKAEDRPLYVPGAFE